ncbi:MAG TPA: hypothetical protein DHW02_22160 [Ktedonobacter sp.]|nr:hypothetical protein [Ktedonobacter sp.]
MKYFKIGIYELAALAVLIAAIALRVVLLALGWPPTDSDEGTMGIMALRIAYSHQHPFVFYGQNYMGTLEAYIGAFLFHFTGPSLFVLRLSVIFFVTIFFISTYLLASLLYSRRIALITLILLTFGSIYVLTRETLSTGGSTQTLAFGSIAFLLSAWLSYSYRRGTLWRTKLLRFIGYTGWGLVLGLGFWSDMIVLPYFAGAVLLMCIFCWRDLLWSWVGVVAGFIVGAYPVLSYSLHAGKSQGVLTTLFGLFHGGATQAPHTLSGILHGIKGTVLISVPTATSYPFCPVMEQSFLSDNTVQTPLCTAGHALWGVGYIALLVIALLAVVFAIGRMMVRGELRSQAVDTHHIIVQKVSHFVLLGSAAIDIAAYSLSSAPAGWPGYHSRYLIGLLIITPALVAVLWGTMHGVKTNWQRLRVYGGRIVLSLVFAICIIGTLMLFTEVPRTQTTTRSQMSLVNYLVQTGHSHFYTDYWSCDKLAFESDERVTCAVLEPDLQVFMPHNRVPGYYDAVHHDSNAAYAFPLGNPQVPLLDKKLSKQHYTRTVVDGYVVWEPA